MHRHTHAQRVTRRQFSSSPHEPTRVAPPLLAAVAAAASLLTTTALAADGTWTNPTAGTYNYSDTTNWLNATPADGAGASALFSTVDPLGDISINVDSARTLGSLTFSDTDPINTPAGWTLTGSTITLEGPPSPTITVDALAAGRTARLDTVLAGTQGLIKSGTGTLHLTAANTYTGGTTINAGTVLLGTGTAGSAASLGVTGATGSVTLNTGATIANGTSGSNGAVGLNYNFTVNGNSTILMGNRMTLGQSGTGNTRTVTLNNNANLTLTLGTTVSRDDIHASFVNGASSTGTVTLNGSGTARAFINGGSFGSGFNNINLVVEGSAFLNPQTNSGGNTIQIGSLSGSSMTAGLAGGSAGSPNYTVGALNASTTFAGGISANAILTKVGTGTLVLTNNTGGLSATAATNVNAGRLEINGAKSGTGNTTVNTGGTLAGTGTISNSTVTINSGGHLAPGSSVGTLTLPNLTLAAGSVLDYEFNPAANDLTVVTGTLTLNGASLNLFNENASSIFSSDGSYNLFQYGGTIGGAGLSALSVDPASQVAGKTYSFGFDGSFVKLTISSAASSTFWNRSTGGSWSTGTNWTGNAAPSAPSAQVSLGGGGTPLAGPATITLDGNKTVGILSLDNPTHPFTLAPGSPASSSLVLDNGIATASINVAAGSHTISAPITLTSLGAAANITGAADALTLSGGIAGNSALSKNGAGTLALASANPNFTGSIAANAGTLHIASASALSAATLNPGAGAVTVAASIPTLTVGTLGIATTPGTLTINSPVNLTVNDGDLVGSVAGSATILKSGAGTLTIRSANTSTGGVALNAGTLAIATGAFVTGPINAANGTTLSMLPTGTAGDASIFPGNALNLAPGATVTLTSAAQGNGFNGPVSGDAASVLSVTGSTSVAAQNTKQFTNMLGTVRIEPGAGLRIASTNLNNGGDNTTFDIQGTLNTRNGGAVSLGAISGSGTLAGPGNAAGTATFTIGLKGTDSTFSGTITDGSAADRILAINKAGTGTLTLRGGHTYTGTTTVSAGTLRLEGQSSWNSLSNFGGAAIAQGANLVFDYTNNSSPAQQILGLLQTAAASSYSTGQLRSSPADSRHGLVLTENPANSTVTLTGAILGDLNLDGLLNGDDFALLDRAVATNRPATWSNGDLNYSGTIDSADYLLIDATYLALNPPPAQALSSFLSQRQSQFGDAYVSQLIAAVPEPTTLSLLALGAISLLPRRRRPA